MEIVKLPVIGWVFVQSRLPHGRSVLTVRPITFRADGKADYCLFDKDEQVLSVVPASPGTAQVMGRNGKDKDFELLGYEVPGFEHPSWDVVLMQSE